MVKRRRSSASSDSSTSVDEEQERKRLLALLDAQCGLTTGVVAGYHSDKDDEGSEQDDDQDRGEGSSGTYSDGSDDEEWTGIDEEIHDRQGVTLTRQRIPAAPVIYFDDATTSKRTTDTSSLAKDSFMSSKIRRADAALQTKDRKGKGKSRITDEEQAEERHLQQLDSSLLSLIKELPASTSSTSLLPKLDSLALPDPRHTVRKDRQAPIDPKAPRLLREALYSSRHERAMKKAKEDREAGIVSVNASKNRNERDGFALTKARRRQQTGEEGKRRASAKGLGGVVGKMRKGGAVLTLNRDEIRKGNEGDIQGLVRRQRGNIGGGKFKGGRR